ncbi:MAG: hypothetical protein IJB67_01035 [Firmicutes bacterium]|nr:hypothetical protein [Bacillota bacterium]
MKKKFLSLTLAIGLLATAAIGGTLAYFTDTDAQTNTFTLGNVKIDLFEDFNSESLNLIPAVGTETNVNGTIVSEMKNTIEKEVYVTNTSTNEAVFTRVHIAIPDFGLRDGTKINAIRLVCDDSTTVDGAWSWSKVAEGANYYGMDNDNWNRYTTDINGIPYKVFVVTYETALNPGQITPDAIHKVYMDSEVTQDEIAAWNTAYGEGAWAKVYVVAEAVQADGFDNAHSALDAGFGAPGSYAVDFTATGKDNDFVDRQSMVGK